MHELLTHPDVAFTLLGLFIILAALVKSSSQRITVKELVASAMLIAIAIILHTIKLYRFPQGGSVTLAMAPLLFIAFAYGPRLGMLSGFIFGSINFILNPYIVHPVQVLFDYPLPFIAMGLTGYAKGRIYWGTTIAMALRLVCHVISGYVFFGSYAWPGWSPLTYAIAFNATYLIPTWLLTMAIFRLLPTPRLLKMLR